MGRAPGIRSYTVQLLTLFLCALRLGEIRQVLVAEEAARWRQRLRHAATSMEETIATNDAVVRSSSRSLARPGRLGICGRWSELRYCAVLCSETCGEGAAWAQELEEWGHIQFFNRQVQTPTCLIVPPGRSVDCALELLPYVKGIGRYTIAVAHSEQPVWPTQIDLVLPVPQAVDEVFSPLVYCLAGELLAYYLAEIRDTPFFCADRPGFSSGRDRVTAIHSVVSMTYVRCPPLTRDNTVLARNHYKRGIQLWNMQTL